MPTMRPFTIASLRLSEYRIIDSDASSGIGRSIASGAGRSGTVAREGDVVVRAGAGVVADAVGVPEGAAIEVGAPTVEGRPAAGEGTADVVDAGAGEAGAPKAVAEEEALVEARDPPSDGGDAELIAGNATDGPR